MDEDQDYVTVAGAARRAGRSAPTVRRWLRDGKLRRYRDGTGRIWIKGSELDALIKPVLTVPSPDRAESRS